MKELGILDGSQNLEIPELTLKVDGLKGEISNLDGKENSKERILKGVLLRGYEIALYALLELERL